MKYRLVATLPVYLALYTLSLAAAFFLRFDLEISEDLTSRLWESLPIALVVKGTVFTATREWRRRHRYTTMNDIVSIVATASLSSAILLTAHLMDLIGTSLPRSVIAIDWLLTVVATGMLRTTVRVAIESSHYRPSRPEKLRAIVFGADPNSISILRALQSAKSEYKVVAMLDQTGATAKSLIGGVPVVNAKRGIAQIADRFSASHLLIPSGVEGKTVRELHAVCQENELTARVIPDVNEIVAGRVKLTIRDVTISDLLRREPTLLDMASITGCIAEKTVLVTGAAGSIGSECCRQIVDLKPRKLILVDQSEFGMFQIEQELVARKITDVELIYVIVDINDQITLGRVFAEHLPDLVFHAAAYKHVPLMEHNVQIAIRNNILGTKSIVDLADRFGVDRFVMISTDKAVRPTSIMGSTKLVGEKYLQAVASKSQTKFITVRFGNVLNSAGSVVPTFRRQILEGGPITVTHPEMTRFFMTIPEAVQLVLQAGAIGGNGQVLILDMGEPVKIVDLARDMISLSGLRYPEDVDIVFTGLRPGEKMYEELFYGNETTAKKVHEKIFCAEREPINASAVKRHILELEQASRGSADEARQAIQAVIADYVDQDEATPMIHQFQPFAAPTRKAA
ncbi:polysaccharide biosynthesis protein [Schlesneria sp. T3-172]|uniref:polysaccharide biosynthesis protein n=1 Tax=Schlesneria sphaerica TaxID=3373610 RepID=UPI0037C50F79